MAEAYLGLGSNLGDRRAVLRAALRELGRKGVRSEAVSSLYETDPVGYLDQPAFLNAVARVQTDRSPEDLLRALKEVEVKLGRQPRFRDGPREIDLDLLLYGQERRDSEALTLPHPRLNERAFVQIPLRELSGPATLPSDPAVRLVEGPGWAADNRASRPEES